MSPPSEAGLCEEVRRGLEALIEDDLSSAVRRRAREHLRNCPACRQQLDLASAVQSGLRSLPHFDAPPGLVERVLERSGRERRPVMKSARRWWAAAAGVLAAAALAGAIVLPLARRQAPSVPPPAAPSAVEIRRAADEARYALAHLSRVSRRTGLEVRDGVFVQRLVVPAARGLRSVAPRSLEEVSVDDEI